MKRILMIAYHFPPLRGSSGIQRTLRFAKYLSEFGWQPIVLTTSPSAYPDTSDDQLADVPDGVPVHRVPALDAARHLAIANRYPGFLARPDRWRSWWLTAVPVGVRLARQHRVHALWSTCPIATAHSIGHTLQRLTNLPWIADFRDPLYQADYPADPKTRAANRAIEAKTARRAARIVLTTPGARRLYVERYPDVAPERIVVIENGYDDETFGAVEAEAAPLNPGALTLLHSGIVYPVERDPTALMSALRRLLESGIARDCVRVRFRAPVHERLIRDLAAKENVSDLIEVLPAIDYRASLAEMQRADALLLLQAANCNEQIPAKLYEYIRARRPIVALTDPAGDTARTLARVGFDWVAPLDDAPAIASLVARFLSTGGSLPSLSEAVVARHSRRAKTAELAALLSGCVESAAQLTYPSRVPE